MVTAGCLAGSLGCAADPEGDPPPLPTTSGAPSSAGPVVTTADTDTDSGLSSASAGGGPAHCQLESSGGGDTTGTSTGEDGFKFDVGAPDGGFSFEFGCEEAATRSTNLGCEFWAVDLPNDSRGTFMSPGAADQQFSIAVGNPSGLAPARVEVFLPAETVPFASATVEPNQTHTFPLPSASIEPDFGTVDGQAFRVRSDLPIVAYQFNPLDNTTPVYSNDASLLLPTHALGQDYVAVTGGAILLSMGPNDAMPVNAGAFVSVVATEDATQVEFDPTATLVGGLPSGVVLDAGQVWTIISSQAEGQTGNLSGTAITSTAPVAVFAGNVATVEPLALSACCADHLEHQLSPRSAWGSRYAIAPPPGARGEGDDTALYRITGSFDDTELLYCPSPPMGAPSTIDAGETIEFTTDQPFTVAAADRKHAFGMAQFILSNEAIDSDGLGDPGMLIVPSAVQFEKRFVFVVPAGYVDNRVTVVAQGDGAVTLDGDAVPQSAFTELGVLDGLQFRYAQLELDEGQHTVEGVGRIGVSVFGYDEAVSFAYPGGAGLRVVSVPPAAG